MFNFSEFPFSTGLVHFFNGDVSDGIILNIVQKEQNFLGIQKVNNIILNIQKNNPTILCL
tara:strand:- start:564 stop:743 length:180 start_codon:yes stop_codon:yes gene_type:complete